MPPHQDDWTDEQLLLTAEKAARSLRVGRTTLYALIKDGQLRSVHIGRSGRLTRADLLRYVHRLDSPADVPRRKGKAQRIALEQPGLFDDESTPPDAA